MKLNKMTSLLAAGALSLSLFSSLALATGMIPETSVVIVEESDGEGAINVKNSDGFPVLLMTSLENIKEDNESLLTITPPAARVEAGKSQRVRFILISKTPLKTERLKRVIFEGVPPKEKGKNEVRMTVRQNLPVLIRPAGLARDEAPWKQLKWSTQGGKLVVTNPSPYVVRMGSSVQTLPDNSQWNMTNSYVLPGQTITLSNDKNKSVSGSKQVRISPATTWGFTVQSYDAALN